MLEKGCTMTTNKMTSKELRRIGDRIENLRVELRRQLGLDKISGGFVEIDFNDYDNEWVYITVKDGVCSDCEDRTNTWQTAVHRKTLELKGG